ncbi:hypothetical protein NVP1084O_138 [Vibrio phage 1.084.O._10N.261.49.F5]|nr:hypothetical protein NVP1084O_138 [Vibrio phage 1.084.O._10N.261.49.F5]
MKTLRITTERYNNKPLLMPENSSCDQDDLVFSHLMAHNNGVYLCDTHSNREILTLLGEMHGVNIEFSKTVKGK